MPVNPSDFLSLIHNAECESEIDYRNIISRGYYGMYHSVLDMLTQRPIMLADGGVHESLKEYLGSHHAKTHEPYDRREMLRLKTFLEIYKVKRQNADYQLSVDISKKEAESAIHATKNLLAKCEEMKAARPDCPTGT